MENEPEQPVHTQKPEEPADQSQKPVSSAELAAEHAKTGPQGCSPTPATPEPSQPPPPQGRFRRLLPDLIKSIAALAVIGLACAIWFKPPLYQTSHPYVSYTFNGQTFKDATLYRPLAMPTRYYVELPHPLTNRYVWFAIDRRREVAALAEEPRHRLLGLRAIKRSDPLGLDLEFRKLDHSEWQVHFFDTAIVFSNVFLTVRLDLDDAGTAAQPHQQP